MFLTKLFGVFLLIIGIAVLINRRRCIAALGQLVENKGLFYLVVTLELVFGLAIILAHNIWTSINTGIISLLGWLAVLESTAYFLLPHNTAKHILYLFNKQGWYTTLAITSIIIGIYLSYEGFSAF